jgi:hypothetical protein
MTFTDQPWPAEAEEPEKPKENRQSSLLGPVLEGLLKEAERALRTNRQVDANTPPAARTAKEGTP